VAGEMITTWCERDDQAGDNEAVFGNAGHADPRGGCLPGLAPTARERLSGFMEDVTLRPRQVLQEYQLPILYVYFLKSGLASLMARGPNGRSIEINLLGSGDMTGLSLVLGGHVSSNRCVVYAEGEASRITARDLLAACLSSHDIHAAFLDYARCSLIHCSQTAVCAATQDVEARIAGWLVMAHERTGLNRLAITHGALARSFGVRRATVTDALTRLRSAGSVDQRRGTIWILNLPALQRRSRASTRASKLPSQPGVSDGLR
jgi:CRP-like cAMP-binding protein